MPSKPASGVASKVMRIDIEGDARYYLDIGSAAYALRGKLAEQQSVKLSIAYFPDGNENCFHFSAVAHPSIGFAADKAELWSDLPGGKELAPGTLTYQAILDAFTDIANGGLFGKLPTAMYVGKDRLAGDLKNPDLIVPQIPADAGKDELALRAGFCTIGDRYTTHSADFKEGRLSFIVRFPKGTTDSERETVYAGLLAFANDTLQGIQIARKTRGGFVTETYGPAAGSLAGESQGDI